MLGFSAVQRRTLHRRLVLLVLIAFGLRIAYCITRGSLGQTGPDYLEYVWVGQRLLEQGTVTSPLITDVLDVRPSALMPPAYVALVTVVYALLGVNTFAATLALHLVNAAATGTNLLSPIPSIALGTGGVQPVEAPQEAAIGSSGSRPRRWPW